MCNICTESNRLSILIIYIPCVVCTCLFFHIQSKERVSNNSFKRKKVMLFERRWWSGTESNTIREKTKTFF